MNQRDDRLPPIDELDLSCFDVLPCRQPASPIGPNAVVAVVDPSRIDIAPVPGARSVPLDLGVVVVERGLVIATGEHVKQRPHDLDVLLRHRCSYVKAGSETTPGISMIFLSI